MRVGKLKKKKHKIRGGKSGNCSEGYASILVPKNHISSKSTSFSVKIVNVSQRR